MSRATLQLDDPTWWYIGFHGQPVTRRLRLYQVSRTQYLAVVTEEGAGTSITNAAEHVAAQLSADFPGRQIRLIEHYPAGPLEEEHFDAVAFTAAGNPTWTRIPTEQIVAQLGPDLLVG